MSELDEQEQAALTAVFAGYNVLIAKDTIAERAFAAGRAYKPELGEDEREARDHLVKTIRIDRQGILGERESAIADAFWNGAKNFFTRPAPGGVDENQREWTAVGEQEGAARAGETIWSGPHLQPGERVTVVPRSRAERAEREIGLLKQQHTAHFEIMAEYRNRAEKAEAEVARLRGRIEELEHQNTEGDEALRLAEQHGADLYEQPEKLREALSDREATMRKWSASLRSSGEGTLECKTISDGEKQAAEFMILAANALDEALDRAREAEVEVAQLRERIEGLGAANQHGREDAGSLDVQVDELTREAKKLREALSFYADEKTWVARNPPGRGCDCWRDAGKRAREALAVSPTGRSEVPASVSEGKSLGESIREASAEVDSWPPPFRLYEPEGSLEREEEMGEGVNDLY